MNAFLIYFWNRKFTAALLIVALIFGFQLYSLDRHTAYGLTATGGTITTNTPASVNIEVLVVGGGGGGGATPSGDQAGGGGGAGGYRYDGAFSITAQAYPVTVGLGGAGGLKTGGNAYGTSGATSTFSTISANGGGGAGASGRAAGAAGGSGGGGSASSGGGGNGNVPSTSPSQGNNGGNGAAGDLPSGGGGGAGAVGGNGSGGTSGNGGNGSSNSISGTTVTYAGGGGGGSRSDGTAGTGGSGGGGNGSNTGDGTAGTDGRGGGGGGGGRAADNSTTGNGGDGGDGIVIISYLTGWVTATGGTITTNGAKTVHTFSSSGTFTVTSITREIHTFTSSGTFTVTGSGFVEALIVAGGGGGGGNGGGGGGGGAGGLIASSSVAVTTQAYTVTVGNGGAGSKGGAGTSGQDSVFATATAVGGGGGGARSVAALNGGSGGGAGGLEEVSSGKGTGTAGQGNNGGDGIENNGGGGGGAGAVGANGVSTCPGNGGVGVSSSISGAATFYAGGGGGSYDDGGGCGLGGNGGGGRGADYPTDNAADGTANTGGGGGASQSALNNVGDGGSGIVIISFVSSGGTSEGGPTFLMGFEAWMKKVTEEGKFPPPPAMFALMIILAFGSAFEYKTSRRFIAAASSAARRLIAQVYTTVIRSLQNFYSRIRALPHRLPEILFGMLQRKFTAALLIVSLIFGFQLYSLDRHTAYGLTATGGTITTSSTASVDVVTVGSGGSAANPAGTLGGTGGGGGGGLTYKYGLFIPVGDVTVTVGAATTGTGQNGGLSAFGTYASSTGGSKGSLLTGGAGGFGGTSYGGDGGGNGGAGGNSSQIDAENYSSAGGGGAGGYSGNGGRGSNGSGDNGGCGYNGSGGGGAGGAWRGGPTGGGVGVQGEGASGQASGNCTSGNGGAGSGGSGVSYGGGSGGSTSGGGAVSVSYLTGALTATGGTITTVGSKTYHTFTSSGTFSVTSVPQREIHTFTSDGTFTVTGSGTVNALVVAGGGGGGNVTAGYQGGGGAGGYVSTTSMAVTAQAYSITVGSGGGTYQNGNNSIFSTITAVGGGKGSNRTDPGGDGGSGGGCAETAGPGSGTAGQGNNGGSCTDSNCAGGGGGAGAVGGNGGGNNPGPGGIGLANNISGSSTYYAGGGGGSCNTGSIAAGGTGGGGAGAGYNAGPNAVSGTANTGGGGGGAVALWTAGTGGSGIVIISFVPAAGSEGGPTFLMGFEAWMKKVTEEGNFPPPPAMFALMIVLALGSAFEYKTSRRVIAVASRELLHRLRILYSSFLIPYSKSFFFGIWQSKFATLTLVVALIFGLQLYSLDRHIAYGLSATGGTITYSGTKVIHTFTSDGTFTVTGTGNVEALVVAGGGGGSGYRGGGGSGGGGGGGGVVASSSMAVTAQAYSITVGGGGSGGGPSSNGNSGNNSVFGSITATGGGFGAWGGDGSAAGSGGSGGGHGGGTGSAYSGGSSTAGQGNDGGDGGGPSDGGGGGGGAGAAGTNANGHTNGVGGNGILSSISGTPTFYGGGGGVGANGNGGVNTSGGSGGGATGGGNNGTANTGGGGGGGSDAATTGGNGGSGTVVISYDSSCSVSTPTTPYVDDVFSTYLYSGNGLTQTINNGIDLSTNGGLVWIKKRSSADAPILTDTARGAGHNLETTSTAADWLNNPNTNLTRFNTNGFNIGAGGAVNGDGLTFASWTFREASRFFDVVTYTGNNTQRTIAHNLGVVPGMIIIKSTGEAPWYVYHRSINDTRYLVLNTTAGEAENSTVWGGQTATASVFGIGTNADVNTNGQAYVAYLFAHDTGTDGIIQAGSWDAISSTRLVTSLGWEPQFLLYKETDAAGDWMIVDNMRKFLANDGTGAAGSLNLRPNTTGAETSQAQVDIQSATGFGSNLNQGPTGKYIYLAIRRPNKPVTRVSEVFDTQIKTGAGTVLNATSTTGFAPDSIWIARRNADHKFTTDRLRGTSYLVTDATDAEASTVANHWQNNTGYTFSFDWNNNNGGLANYAFRRAPGVFDVVAYTGDGNQGRTVSHSLGVVPELMIVKTRSAAGENWPVYSSGVVNSKALRLNTTAAQFNSGAWFSTTPTSTLFTVGTTGDLGDVNANAATYVAYLFATKAGVSKVGSYTGNGSALTIDAGFASGAKFVLIKRTDSTGDWIVWDSVRGIVSGNDPHLNLNDAIAEATGDDSIDSDNSGFIVNQDAATNVNVNNATYIYLAFAAGLPPQIASSCTTENGFLMGMEAWMKKSTEEGKFPPPSVLFALLVMLAYVAASEQRRNLALRQIRRAHLGQVQDRRLASCRGICVSTDAHNIQPQ